MKNVLIGLIVVLGVTTAVVVGYRLETEALAVLVGIACGVAAGIPTSFLILVAMHRHDVRQAQDTLSEYPPANPYPHITDAPPSLSPSNPNPTRPPLLVSGRDLIAEPKEDR